MSTMNYARQSLSLFIPNSGYLGLLDFGQMYDGKSVFEHARLILMMACICLSKFTFDFCESVDGGKGLWKEYSENLTTIRIF